MKEDFSDTDRSRLVCDETGSDGGTDDHVKFEDGIISTDTKQSSFELHSLMSLKQEKPTVLQHKHLTGEASEQNSHVAPSATVIRPIPRPSAFTSYSALAASKAKITTASTDTNYLATGGQGNSNVPLITPSHSSQSFEADWSYLTSRGLPAFSNPFTFWNTPEVPCQCGRGCCSLPASENSVSPKTPLMGPEYMENDEESFTSGSHFANPSALGGTAREHLDLTAGQGFGRPSETSISVGMQDVILQMMLPILHSQTQQLTEEEKDKEKDKITRGESNDLVGIVQQMIAREISRHTMAAVQAHQCSGPRSL